MKRALGFCIACASVFVLSQACGSSDSKKKAPGTPYTTGGQAGEDSGGGAPTSGKSGSNAAGELGAGEEGGSANGASGGEAGAGGVGSGDDCPTGFAECDGDPTTVCEQDVTLVTSCGDCDTTCDATNASVACEDGACVVKSCNDGFGDCNGSTANDACETSLVNNDEHCGTCERDCAAVGSTCSTNKCNEIPMQQGQPIGSDGSANVTWAFSPSGLLHTPVYPYVVRRYPLDGSATQTLWNSTSKSVGTESLLVIGDEVYWSEQGTSGNDFTSAVYKKTITAASDVTPTLVFAPEWNAILLRKQGSALYWFSGGYQSGDPGAYAYTRAIGAPLSDHGTKIVSVDQGTHNGIEAFNVTSNALYWITTIAGAGTAYELRTTPLSGGTPTVVPPASEAYPTTAVSNYYGTPSLQVVADTLYFNRDANDAADGIYKFKTGDAAPQLLVKADDVTGLLVDDSFIYYVRQNTAGIWRAKLEGSAGAQISDDPVSKIVGQDAQFVYAISSTCCAGNIYKVIK